MSLYPMMEVGEQVRCTPRSRKESFPRCRIGAWWGKVSKVVLNDSADAKLIFCINTNLQNLHLHFSARAQLRAF